MVAITYNLQMVWLSRLMTISLYFPRFFCFRIPFSVFSKFSTSDVEENSMWKLLSSNSVENKLFASFFYPFFFFFCFALRECLKASPNFNLFHILSDLQIPNSRFASISPFIFSLVSFFMFSTQKKLKKKE